jgi:hypothetical protein
MNAGNSKAFLALNSVTSSVGETVTCRIDTLGYDFCTLNLVMSSTAASSNQPTILKVSQGATTTAASAADIVRLTGGTATSTTVGYVIPAAQTNSTLAAQALKFNIDLRGKQRYLFLTVGVATTISLTAFGELVRGEQIGTAASQGLVGLVEG